MADYVLQARIKLKDEFSRGLKSARATFSSFGKYVDRNTKTLNADFGTLKKGISGVGSELKALRNIAIGAGALIGGVAWSSYKSYADLNKQLVRNRALSGASAADTKKLEDQVKSLGRTTSFTAKEVAEAQQYQFMAGYSPEDVLKTTPKLLQLSVASGQDLASTSDIITDSLTAFGLKTKDLDEYLDVLTGTANKTNTSVGMLGNSFQYIAPVSTALGENYKEVAVMLGILADNGIKGEKAGTALRGMFSRLSKPTKDMREALAATNTKLYDSKGNFKGLRKIIEEAKPALMRMTSQQRNYWLATIAGTEGLSAWNAIMNNSTESTEKAEKAVYKAEGSLDKFYKTMTGADQQTIDELKSSFDGLRTALGEALSPFILKGMKELTKYINSITDSGKINSESIRSYFNVMKKEGTKALKVVGALWGVINLIRAGFGDPTAIANLALGATALGAYFGKELGDNAVKSMNSPNLNAPAQNNYNNTTKPAYTPGMGVGTIPGQGQQTPADINKVISDSLKNNLMFQPKKEVKISFGDVHINNGMDKDKFFSQLTELMNYA